MTPDGDAEQEIEIHTGRDRLVGIDKIVRNTQVDVLLITTSKAEVVLHREWHRIGGRRDWATPLGTLIAIVVALMTTDFVKRFGVSADVWEAGFWIAALLCGAWLISSLVQLLVRGPALHPQQVVELLTHDGKIVQSTSWISATTAATAGTAAKAAAANSPAAEPTNANGELRDHDPPAGHGHKPDPPVGTTGGSTVSTGFAASGRAHPLHDLPLGARVTHPNFGTGTVVGHDPGPPHSYVRVNFDDRDVGIKKLREDLAPLRPTSSPDGPEAVSR